MSQGRGHVRRLREGISLLTELFTREIPKTNCKHRRKYNLTPSLTKWNETKQNATIDPIKKKLEGRL